VIEEKGVRLRLNIVDTPGYGDQINNDRWYVNLNRVRLIEVGILLSSISRINIPHIYEKNSLLNGIDIFRTLVFTAVSSSFSPLDMRTSTSRMY
jgi:hypothetical protein